MTMYKHRILYTEDDPDTRELVILLLGRRNCEVVATDNKDFAILSARTEHFDLYLLDNWLQDTSGIDLCRELRSINANTPILFYSAAAYDTDKESALKSGAQGYLTKPVETEHLVNEVMRLIEGVVHCTA